LAVLVAVALSLVVAVAPAEARRRHHRAIVIEIRSKPQPPRREKLADRKPAPRATPRPTPLPAAKPCAVAIYFHAPLSICGRRGGPIAFDGPCHVVYEDPFDHSISVLCGVALRG
jgi:hypothetical protein